MAEARPAKKYLLSDIVWAKADRARREYGTWVQLRSHPAWARFLEGLAPGIPFPKFMTHPRYYSIADGPLSRTEFSRGFILTDEGKADSEVVSSYEAWYNYEDLYTLREDQDDTWRARRVVVDDDEDSSSAELAQDGSGANDFAFTIEGNHDIITMDGGPGSGRYPKGSGEKGLKAAQSRAAKRSGATGGRTDTSERQPNNSLGAHTDATGNLTAEREALHQEILGRKFAGATPAEGQPVFTVMGGGPAAGKSTMTRPGGVKLTENSVLIDPDEFKGELPEYRDMVSKGDLGAAHYAHEESSALAKRGLTMAHDGGYNCVLDGTGDGSDASLMKKVQDARAAGCYVKGIYATVPTQVALDRAQERAKKTGRDPGEETIRKTHAAVSKILPRCAHEFDEVELYDTSTTTPVLIAKGGGGKGLTAMPGQEAVYSDFLAKAKEKI